jgi:DNA adenine methylase
MLAKIRVKHDPLNALSAQRRSGLRRAWPFSTNGLTRMRHASRRRLMYAISPLRYPGAKWRLERFICALLEDNGLSGGHYAEPYAGGASLALSLLFQEKVSQIHLNDLDRSIWAFWRSVLDHPKELIAKIRRTKVTIKEWHLQREVQIQKSAASVLELGFSTFFLNRTNRSGILTAGVIGGKDQSGPWRLDARFNTEDLVNRIQKISTYKTQIHLTKLDALTFVLRRNDTLPASATLLYLDPPYFKKGQGLYMNAYEPDDHSLVASVVTKQVGLPWVVSYDDVPEIRSLYANCRRLSYSLRYSASTTRQGREAIFVRRGLISRPKLLVKA